MNTAIQSGFQIRYKLWADLKTYTHTIEGATRFKKFGCFDILPSYKFYDKKGNMLFYIQCAEMYYIQRVFTTTLEERPVSFFTKVKNFFSKTLQK